MTEKKISVEELATFCKKKGFVFKAAEIYGGLAGFFDLGPLGFELNDNLKNSYKNFFILKREDMFPQNGSIITNPKVWKASGHVDNFADLILTTKESKTKLRADHFIEDTLKIPGDSLTANDINKLVKENNLKYKGEEFEEVKDFNLMFSTQVGADTSKNATAYLRPETCQSIFPNFKLIADSSRAKLPFGIIQIGKAFRNEISPRDFVFRSREFEQMEMEYFFNPETKCEQLSKKELETKFKFLSSENQDKDSDEMIEISIKDLIKKKKLNDYHGYWLAQFYNWFVEELKFSKDNLRIREHTSTELSHYSKGTFDIDYNFPFGFKEMLGMANRSDFDLKQHQTHSKSKLEFFDEETKTKLLPHVIEPSLGVERFMMATIYEAYNNDEKRGNIVLNFPFKLAPTKVAVFPLMNKPELTSLARQIYDELIEEEIQVVYDKSGSIGKRYARQDEVGTPFCLTIDYEAIEEGKDKGTITIRDRNTTEQKRIPIETASGLILSLIKGKIEFKDL
ncbi:MAG: glycine--tRNA ligase [Nanoarchaeota archaeon]|nr:glycine--tRNA ligase [Nanoarchaeota archaeon]